MHRISKLFAMVLLAACTTNGSSVSRTDDKVLRSLSWTSMQCVYLSARVIGSKDISPQHVEAAIPNCEREISTYINSVAKRVQNDNGWSSLQPSVRPALRREYESRLVTLIAREQ